MPAKAKLSDAQVKKIRRRARAGARLTKFAAEYGVNRKTIRRRLDALELAEAERARRSAGRSKRPPSRYEARKLDRLPDSLLDYHDVRAATRHRAREAHASGRRR